MINLAVSGIQGVCLLVMQGIAIIDIFLAGVMNKLGLAPQMQLFIILTLSIMLVIGALRTVGTVMSGIVIILVVLLLMHRVIPNSSAANYGLPGGLPGLNSAMLQPMHQ